MGSKLKNWLLLSSLVIGLLCLFSSVEVVRANITTVNHTVEIAVFVFLGVLVFLLALIGWFVMKRLNQKRKLMLKEQKVGL